MIKAMNKILTHFMKNIEKELDELTRVENNEKKKHIMLKGYRLGYEFETTERICDVAFKLGFDVDVLFMGLFRQYPRLLDECGLSVISIRKALNNYHEKYLSHMPIDVNFGKEYIISIEQEHYAKAILDYLENKPLEK